MVQTSTFVVRSSSAITIANLEFDDARLPLHGAIDFTDTSAVSITLTPDATLYQLTAIAPAKCVSGVNVFGSRRMDSSANAFSEIQEIELKGGLIRIRGRSA